VVSEQVKGFQNISHYSDYQPLLSSSRICERWDEQFLLSGLADVLSFLCEESSDANFFSMTKKLAADYFAVATKEYFMAMALILAHRNIQGSSPNPCVGCVYVKEGKVVGMGYTQSYGGLHAERHAYENVSSAQSLCGAEAYVSLEPCCHHYSWKSGQKITREPCAVFLHRLGISKVNVAILDPDQQVSGGGVQHLLDCGIAVQVGLLKQSAQRLLWRYILHRKRVKQGTKRNITIGLKWAQSLDGRLAAPSGQSQWISSPSSLIYSQWLRYVYDGVMVGAGTFINDRPALSLRHPFCVRKSVAKVKKIIFDPQFRTLRFDKFQDHYRHMKDNAEVYWIGRKDMSEEATKLARMQFPSEERHCVMSIWDPDQPLQHLFENDRFLQITSKSMSLLVEGGPRLHNMLIGADVVDFLHIVTAPLWLGGKHEVCPSGPVLPHDLDHPPYYSLIHHQRFGQDLLSEYAHTHHKTFL